MEVEKTPMTAIKMKCLECCNWSHNEVTNCKIHDCALWAYRKGHRPNEHDIAIVHATKDTLEDQKRKFGVGRFSRRAGSGKNLSIYRTNNKQEGFEGDGADISSPRIE